VSDVGVLAGPALSSGNSSTGSIDGDGLGTERRSGDSPPSRARPAAAAASPEPDERLIVGAHREEEAAFPVL
jgi:hypothetical protein